MLELTRFAQGPHGAIVGTLALSFEERQRSRYKTRLESGEEAWLLLPRGRIVRGGDVLLASDDRAVRVLAKPEALMEARTSDALTLARAAYHLGNRHAHVEVGRDYLRVVRDRVYRDMLHGLGLEVHDIDAPFEPEAGAYAAGHAHHAHGAKHAGIIHDHHHG